MRRRELAAALRLLRRATKCLELLADQLHMLEHMSPWEYQEVRRVLGHGSGFDSPWFRRVRRSHRARPGLPRLLREQGITVVEMYQRGREFEDSLYQLAELLIEWDERLTLWRVHHYKLVERIIGDAVVGTQGTPVEVLGNLVHKTRYPEALARPQRLTALSQAED